MRDDRPDRQQQRDRRAEQRERQVGDPRAGQRRAGCAPAPPDGGVERRDRSRVIAGQRQRPAASVAANSAIAAISAPLRTAPAFTVSRHSGRLRPARHLVRPPASAKSRWNSSHSAESDVKAALAPAAARLDGVNSAYGGSERMARSRTSSSSAAAWSAATLAVALDAHGLAAIVVDPADPAVMLAPRLRRPRLGDRERDRAGCSTRSASARRLAGQGCPIAAIRVSDGLEPGALDFVPRRRRRRARARCSRIASCARALFEAASAAPLRRPADADARGRGRARRWRASPRRSSDGTTVSRAAAGRRRGAQLADARGGGDHGRALDATIMPRSSAPFHHERRTRHRLRDLLSRRPVRAAAAARRRPWGIARRSSGRSTRATRRACSSSAIAASWPKPRRGWAASSARCRHASPRVELPARLPPRRADHRGAARAGRRRRRTASIRSRGRALNLGFRDVATLVEVLVEGKRLGLDLGDAQLLARYQRWRGLDTFMVAAATDRLTRLFGIPGKTASAVRRFGISAVNAHSAAEGPLHGRGAGRGRRPAEAVAGRNGVMRGRGGR